MLWMCIGLDIRFWLLNWVILVCNQQDNKFKHPQCPSWGAKPCESNLQHTGQHTFTISLSSKPHWSRWVASFSQRHRDLPVNAADLKTVTVQPVPRLFPIFSNLVARVNCCWRGISASAQVIIIKIAHMCAGHTRVVCINIHTQTGRPLAAAPSPPSNHGQNRWPRRCVKGLRFTVVGWL